jgi:hypothetical protein
MAERNVQTTKIGGGADYAKVADRIKEFRTAFPNSKIEIGDPVYDAELVIFSAWIWKDKKDLIELMKAGVTDKETLRSSADGNGSARSRVGVKEKDFEKLQTIAVGRALSMIGYLASGEIAGFEEMEEFTSYQQEKRQKYIDEQVELFKIAKDMDALRALWMDTDKTIPEIIATKDKRKAELEKKPQVKGDKVKENAGSK